MVISFFLFTFAPAFKTEEHWRDGRVVDYSSLENYRTERYRGFESLSLRKEFSTSLNSFFCARLEKSEDLGVKTLHVLIGYNGGVIYVQDGSGCGIDAFVDDCFEYIFTFLTLFLCCIINLIEI